MLNRLHENRDIFLYYFFFGLKGLALYLVLYTLNETELFQDTSKFIYFYSIFLMIVPLYSMGVGSYILRNSYYEQRQDLALSLLFLLIFFQMIFSVVLLFKNIDYGVVSLWAVMKSVFMAYEAYLISIKKHQKVVFFYIIQFLGLILASISVALGYISEFISLILFLILLDIIVFPFVIKKIQIRYVVFIIRSHIVRAQLFSYLLPVVGISFLVALYVNMDKVLIGSMISISAVERYGYLFIFMFSAHRFITTPFIMNYSSTYYRAKYDEIPSSLIIRGLFILSSALFLIGVYFYFFQKNKFDLNLILAFMYFVCSLYLMNLQVLFFKKMHLIKLLLKYYVIIVVFSFFTLVVYLYCFGLLGVELILVVNSMFTLLIFSWKSKSIGSKFVVFMCLVSFLFYLKVFI